ncbi:Omp28-related outer membrane protein [Myroides pelagicus]|nr:Omp28-related outer membrane protein [Myroides pelagicus]MEC4113196.1 Omp28-related outer membrane protein [Myroides pelagicus]
MKKTTVLKLLLAITAVITLTSCSSSSEEEVITPKEPIGDYAFKHKALLEEYTSISCTYCPYGAFILQELEKTEIKDKYISVAVHDNFGGIKDPFKVHNVNDFIKATRASYFPALFWNRNKNVWGIENAFFNLTGEKDELNEDKTLESIRKRGELKTSSIVGIKINSDIKNTKGQVTFSVKFAEDFNQDIKYSVYIIEDGLKQRQYNGTPLYGNKNGSGRWENDFIHNHVLRAADTFLGTIIPSSQTLKNKETTLTVELDQFTVENIENSSVVVVIMNNNGAVLNSQKAKANTKQDYEIIK